MSNVENFKVWNIEKYKQAGTNFIANNYVEYELDDLVDMLSDTVEGYHLRVDPNKNYILFGDVDGYAKGIKRFKTLLRLFLEKHYGIVIEPSDIKYTSNSSKDGSYHFSIPKYYCTAAKIKEIMEHFVKLNKEDFKTTSKSKTVDMSIYNVHWFRYPNQLKEGVVGSEHVIQEGDMVDFIIEYIPEEAVDISKIELPKPKEELPTKKQKKIRKKKKEEVTLYESSDDEDNVVDDTDVDAVDETDRTGESNSDDDFKAFFKKDMCKVIVVEPPKPQKSYSEIILNIVTELSINKNLIKLKDIYKKFRQSDYFFELNNATKRLYNYKFLINHIRENDAYKNFYRMEDFQKNKAHYTNVLVGWQPIQHTDNA